MSIPTARLYEVAGPALLTALTDDEDTGAPEDSLLAKALAAAEEEVRAALRQAGYTGDVALTPLLERTAAVLAVAALHGRRAHIPPEAWAARAAESRVLLDRVATGRWTPPGLPRASPAVRKSPEPGTPMQRLHDLKGL